MSRPARLQAAKHWLPTYRGGDLVRDYRKWFGVSEVCAVVELRLLGVDIPDARLEQARRNEQARAAHRARRKQTQAGVDGWVDADEEFAFIAGCTPGGAPYGIEQEVADAAWEQDLAWRRVVNEAGGVDRLFDGADLPF